MIWPKLPSEVVDDFNYLDDDEFRTIRRKLARWTIDNAAALRDANRSQRPASTIASRNWKTLLAIADLAGGDWPKRARAAALELRKRIAPSRPTGSRRWRPWRSCFAVARRSRRPRSARPDRRPDFGVVQLPRQRADLQTQFAALLRPYRDLPGSLAPDEARET